MTEKYSAQPSVCVCPSRNQLESEEIVADLVHCFLLPEVQKNTVRDKSESSPSFMLLLSAGGDLRPLRFCAGGGSGVRMGMCVCVGYGYVCMVMLHCWRASFHGL